MLLVDWVQSSPFTALSDGYIWLFVFLLLNLLAMAFVFSAAVFHRWVFLSIYILTALFWLNSFSAVFIFSNLMQFMIKLDSILEAGYIKSFLLLELLDVVLDGNCFLNNILIKINSYLLFSNILIIFYCIEKILSVFLFLQYIQFNLWSIMSFKQIFKIVN